MPSLINLNRQSPISTKRSEHLSGSLGELAGGASQPVMRKNRQNFIFRGRRL
jgi:hypothetical protein